MIDISYDFILSLQKEVLQHFGIEVMSPGECKNLSRAILQKTTQLISETTLKRVFGFAVAQHSFSRFTLNTLAQYCDYKDWESFQQHHYMLNNPQAANAKNGSPIEVKIQELRTKASAVSHYTMLTLQNRSGINFQHTVKRQYMVNHVEKFLESNYTATALIAPSGWGKSISLVHMSDHFWHGTHPKFKDDICFFIHAHAAGSLLLKGFSLSTWLDQQLTHGTGDNFREHFAAEFMKNGSRLVMIIDGFDEIAVSAEKLKLIYTKLEDFIYTNEKFPWIKVILSVRSSTWNELFQRPNDYSAFRRYWYVGSEMDEETNINVKQLSDQEIRNVLEKHEYPESVLKQFSESFFQKLRHPYYLQLFCQLNPDPKTSFIDENLSLFEIISRFVQNKVFISPTSSFKIKIIQRLLTLLDMGRNGMYVEKIELLDKNPELFPAYKDLLADNILVEENLSQEIMYHVKVRFAHAFLLEYFVAMHYLQKNSQQVGETILEDVLSYLPASPYRVGVFKWLLRFAINHKQTDGIIKMLHLQLSMTEKSHLLEYLVLHYQLDGNDPMELRSIFPAGFFKKNPIGSFINDEFIHFRKKKVLWALLPLADTQEDKLKIRSMLFTISLLQLEAEECEMHLQAIKKIYGPGELEDLWVTPHEILLFIYERMKFGVADEQVLQKIYSYHHYLIPCSTTGKEPATSIPQEIVIRNMGYALALMEDYGNLLQFTKLVFAAHPSLLRRKTDSFRLQILCWQTHALARMGDMRTAERVCRHTDIIIRNYASDYFSSKYVESLQKMISADYYYKEQDLMRAMRTAENAVETAQKLDFKILALRNLTLLKSLYAKLNMSGKMEDTQTQIDTIKANTSFKHEALNFARKV
ncbi:NACHT domain-containing NTPase [Chitinophaga sp. sic0106]|uniref:NACHT domain-containing protein n=1 Tax=Chitinophaga sp. sic0106 TaxID=2854785 RepID=UPI001C478CEC|nr:NACHT domain-containing protein [Chitinophaga sp. sic0106]MBV7528513.1 NACHT domain-containing protein [Chitinophaga sp. sic0106]